MLSDNEIKAQPIKHFENLSYLVPNLNFAASDSRARYFQIRGIGERSGYLGTPNSSVGFLIDDVDYSGQGGIATLFDVDQIEVIRGPQASRIGANALAGLIYIKTKEPTEEFEASSEINLGSYNTQSAGMALSGPVTKNKDVKFRFVVRQDQSDGFRKNLFLNKSDTSRKDELTLRLKIDFELSETSNSKLLLSSVDMDDPADIWTIDNSLNTLSDRPGMDSQKTDTLGYKYFKKFDQFELQSFTSTTDTFVVFSYDADWGNSESHAPYTYDYFSETLRDRQSFNQEFRLVSNSNNLPFSWVLGTTFLSLDETNDRQDDGIYGDPSDPFGPYESLTISSSDYSSNNLSFFGNIDYELAKDLVISLGIRAEEWKAKYSDTNNENFNLSNDMFGGKVSVSYLMENIGNAYLSYAKGYKQGGFNVGLGLLGQVDPNELEYDPEYLTNYELGINSKISDFTDLSFNIFYSQREDQQVLISTQVDPNDPNTFVYLTQNAAEGLNYGFEGSIDTQLNDALSLFLNLGYLETEIKNWASRTDIEGREQAHAPKYSFSTGVEYYFQENTSFEINFLGKSGFYYSDSHNNKSDSYVLTNAALRHSVDNWVIDLWVQNLFDEYYSTRGFFFGNEAPDFIDTLYRRHGDPRHFGLSVRYDF
ncbi:MAG: TonB-dependent receptor [Pseudomonadota bacterium]|nr:TonB-dependent receptor [Pseudomonadota bacterium]